MSTMAQSNAISDAPDDADLQLKKRARRRLVGAVALVLFAVIVLPMVMDHEPRAVAPEIQVRIPSQDGPGFVGRIAPGKAARSTPLPVPSADQGKPDEPTKVAAAPKEAVSLPAPDNKPIAKPITKPDIKPETKPETKQEAGKQIAPPAAPAKQAEKSVPAAIRSADEIHAAAVLRGNETGSQGGATGQWIVQLGAYKEAGNVKLLTAKIKEMGISVYAEKFDSPQGARTRVRAGPFASREAAEKAQAKIRKIINVDGPVAQK